MFLGIYEKKHPKLTLKLTLNSAYLSEIVLSLYKQVSCPRKGRRIMTRNQIAFFTAKEQQRANRAAETETKRHNVAGETISSATQQEAARHNKEQEAVNWFTAQNLGSLQAAQASAAYASASKLASEVGVQALIASETQRHDMASEQEATRHNVAQEQTTASRVANQNFNDSFRTGVDTAGTIVKAGRDVLASVAGVTSLFR